MVEHEALREMFRIGMAYGAGATLGVLCIASLGAALVAVSLGLSELAQSFLRWVRDRRFMARLRIRLKVRREIGRRY